MYNGSHAAPRKGRNSKKPLLLLLSLVLVVALAVGGTLAWLTAKTEPVVNTFTAGTGGTGIEETFNSDKTAKTAIKVKNEGNTEAYVRVMLVINRIDESGAVIADSELPSLNPNTANWQDVDGVYYYKGTLGENQMTENLLADGSTLTLKDGDKLYEVNVMAQTIQVGGGAVEAAWGMTYADGTWTAVQG